jgi:hypothetical protein
MARRRYRRDEAARELGRDEPERMDASRLDRLPRKADNGLGGLNDEIDC